MNTYLIRTQLKDFIISSDYKIINATFVEKVCRMLSEQLELNFDEIPVAYTASQLDSIYNFRKDQWGNYDYDFVNGFGTLQSKRVVFVEIMKK